MRDNGSKNRSDSLSGEKKPGLRFKKSTLSLIVPVFNEADAIKGFITKINQVFDAHPNLTLELVFVNDGSSDSTREHLIALQQDDNRIVIIDLSRNFGKEAALTAGIDLASGDMVVPIDVDLQDPPELIPEMIEKWQEGYEVVLARRVNRDSDSWVKRASATWFYKIHNQIASPSLPENVGDFRLMDRSVVDALKTLPESCRFMKGLFAWAGFHTASVFYRRPERSAGATKFNGWKLWNLALDGITSFSTIPLRIFGYIGFSVSTLSFMYASFIMLRVVFLGIDLPGYASMMVVITFLGGLQLLGIGVIGEYLGRVYMESKRRPVYLIRRIYRDSADEKTEAGKRSSF
jgi:glycosyltransferase involved in cell wall biosynthesis